MLKLLNILILVLCVGSVIHISATPTTKKDCEEQGWFWWVDSSNHQNVECIPPNTGSHCGEAGNEYSDDCEYVQ
jgi:hypothetical protein